MSLAERVDRYIDLRNLSDYHQKISVDPALFRNDDLPCSAYEHVDINLGRIDWLLKKCGLDYIGINSDPALQPKTRASLITHITRRLSDASDGWCQREVAHGLLEGGRHIKMLQVGINQRAIANGVMRERQKAESKGLTFRRDLTQEYIAAIDNRVARAIYEAVHADIPFSPTAAVAATALCGSVVFAPLPFNHAASSLEQLAYSTVLTAGAAITIYKMQSPRGRLYFDLTGHTLFRATK